MQHEAWGAADRLGWRAAQPAGQSLLLRHAPHAGRAAAWQVHCTLPPAHACDPPALLRTWPPASGWWTAASSATFWRPSSRSRPWAPWRPRRRCEGRAAPACRTGQQRACGWWAGRRRAVAGACRCAARLTAVCAASRCNPPCLPLYSGLDVLGKFAGFIKSSPEEAAAKEAELVRARLHGGCGTAAAPGLQPRAAGLPAGQRFLCCGGKGAAAMAARPSAPAPADSRLPNLRPPTHTPTPQVECLRGLDAHLAAHGPFIGGAAPCATDMAVWPRLYHMQVRGCVRGLARTRGRKRWALRRQGCHTPAARAPVLAPRAPRLQPAPPARQPADHAPTRPPTHPAPRT